MNKNRLADRESFAVDALVTAALYARPTEMRWALDAASDVFGVARCIDSVLVRALSQIEQTRETDVRPAGGISLMVETARAWLDNLAARAPTPEARQPVVLACGPGERHTLGLEALTVLLRYRRQPCRLRSARVSAQRVSVTVEVNRPAAVVLATQLRSGHRDCVDLLQALQNIGTTTFYAGAAFDAVTQRRDVPGTYLGTSFQRACAVIVRALAIQTVGAPPTTE